MWLNARSSPDGSLLVSVHQNKTLVLRDGKTGKERKKLNGHRGDISAVIFPSTDRIVSAERDGPAIVWDALTGKQLSKFQHGYPEAEAVALSPDGTLIAAARAWSESDHPPPHPIGVWRLPGGERVAEVRLETHDPASALAISKDGRLLLAATFSGDICEIELPSGKVARCANGIGGAGTNISPIVISPDGTTAAYAITYLKEASVYLWRIGRGVIGSLPTASTAHTLAFAPDSAWLATGGADTVVTVWPVPRK